MRFAIIDDDRVVVSIDVLETRVDAAPELEQVARGLLACAVGDPDFFAGAVHCSLEPWRQPLVWLGAALLFKDVTRPGPYLWLDRPLGTAPRLRCYSVRAVITNPNAVAG